MKSNDSFARQAGRISDLKKVKELLLDINNISFAPWEVSKEIRERALDSDDAEMPEDFGVYDTDDFDPYEMAVDSVAEDLFEILFDLRKKIDEAQEILEEFNN